MCFKVEDEANDKKFLPQERQPRFIHNESGRFESRFVTIKVGKSAASDVHFKKCSSKFI